MVDRWERKEHDCEADSEKDDRPPYVHGHTTHDCKVEPHEETHEKIEETRHLRRSAFGSDFILGLPTHLRELPPVKVVASIKLEDEDVVDFGMVKDAAIETEQEGEE